MISQIRSHSVLRCRAPSPKRLQRSHSLRIPPVTRSSNGALLRSRRESRSSTEHPARSTRRPRIRTHKTKADRLARPRTEIKNLGATSLTQMPDFGRTVPGINRLLSTSEHLHPALLDALTGRSSAFIAGGGFPLIELFDLKLFCYFLETQSLEIRIANLFQSAKLIEDLVELMVNRRRVSRLTWHSAQTGGATGKSH